MLATCAYLLASPLQKRGSAPSGKPTGTAAPLPNDLCGLARGQPRFQKCDPATRYLVRGPCLADGPYAVDLPIQCREVRLCASRPAADSVLQHPRADW